MSKIGKLRYQIRLDDGRLWERHVDHVVGVGDNLLPRGLPVDYSENHPFVPQTAVTTSTRPLVDQNKVSAGADPAGHSSSSATMESPIVSGTEQSSPARVPETRTGVSNQNSEENVQPLRRTTRIIKPPQRLNL